MDLAYNPGELDYKNDREIKHDLEHKNDRELKESGLGLKRDHDSVDDFEHLDPDSSPVDIPFDSKSLTTTTKSLKSDLDKNDEVPKSDEFSFGTGNGFSNGKDLLSDIKLESHQPNKDSTEINLKTNQMDFEITSDNHPMTENTEQDNALNLNFISAEKAVNSKKTDSESDLIGLETSNKETGKIIEVVHDDVPTLPKEAEGVSGLESKSMKEADAMSHYDLKFDKKDFGMKDDQTDVKNTPELNKSHKDSEVISPNNLDTEGHAGKEISNNKDFEIKEELSSSHPKPEPLEPKPFLNKPPSAKDPLNEKPTIHEESKDVPPADDIFQPRVCICPSKPDASADLGLDDIIGPEDVFKRFGLVEALVYWRDPKKSGAVFGVVMAILVSLCFFSLISVLAYTSLFALVGAINFRIYKNVLQAIQKTSEGHPFKEYLDMELSLPQDKVREMTDTAVVHINAAIVELRRLFLVEDLIDSMKFAVCLWCFTYVGAIFNGMTLVILAFVALFTVPKIYENNKASIDTYIDMGRSKVAEITSKVKAAVPIGKKEPEKDKEQ